VILAQGNDRTSRLVSLLRLATDFYGFDLEHAEDRRRDQCQENANEQRPATPSSVSITVRYSSSV